MKNIIIITLLALLVACTQESYTHTVKNGETLYGIATKYNLNWQQLAEHNKIKPPYNIYNGDIIDLSIQTTNTNKETNKEERPLILADNKNKQSQNNTTASNTVKTTNSKQQNNNPKKDIKWNWPVKGNVLINPKNTSLSKGIDIAGKTGTPVMAAASGTVVYAGNALKSYGELIIIKHNDVFVSTYAHNSKILVTEGQHVFIGETVAEMGSTSASSVRLHFEIRHMGKPVDPLAYLPK